MKTAFNYSLLIMGITGENGYALFITYRTNWFSLVTVA